MNRDESIQSNFFVPLSLDACEALSWAVVGELLMVLPDKYAPLYPDTMPNYNNMWLQGELDRENITVMNRLGGQIDDTQNLWSLAQSDPRNVVDLLVRENNLRTITKRTTPQAELSFRIAHWLLESAPALIAFRPGTFESAPSEYIRANAKRHIENLGNYDENEIRIDLKQLLPDSWHSTEPRWLNVLYEEDSLVACVNMQTGEYLQIAQDNLVLPALNIRDDGFPGCPLGSRIRATREQEEMNLIETLGMSRFRAKHLQLEGFVVKVTPIMSFNDDLPWWLNLPDSVKDYLADTPHRSTQSIPDQIVTRIRESAPEESCVLSDSLPVLCFGDPFTSRVATIGLNPSDQEFMRKGDWLLDDERRLHSLRSLGAPSAPELTLEQVNAAYEDMLNYFSRNPLRTWFNSQNKILQSALNADYYDGSACHLDLVQWATFPKQSEIPAATWQRLVEEDRKFLEWQLATTSATTIVMISQGTVSTLVNAGIAPTLAETKLQVPNSKQSLTAYFGEKDGRKWIGWNLALYQPVADGLPQLLIQTIRDLSLDNLPLR